MSFISISTSVPSIVPSVSLICLKAGNATVTLTALTCVFVTVTVTGLSSVTVVPTDISVCACVTSGKCV